MNKKLKILVDVDGVVCDLVGEVLKRLNNRLGSSFTPEHINKWDFFDKDSGVFKESELQHIREIFAEEGLTNESPLIKGCKETLEKIAADHEIVWLTAPWEDSKTWCYDRTKWIKRELGHISKKIIFTWNKEEIVGDLLIDDNPDFIKRWEDNLYNCNGRGLLFKQPWNIQIGIDNSFVFLDDWEDSMLSFLIDDQIFLHKKLSEI